MAIAAMPNALRASSAFSTISRTSSTSSQPGLVPKPASQTYDKFLGLHRVDAERAVMFEDLARNLEVPKALGMRTVLIVPRNLEESFGDVWEHEGREGSTSTSSPTT